MDIFNADKPISCKEEDLLGRSDFSESIAKVIIEQKDAESHVIGIYGQWGSGKTSTLNLIKEAVIDLSKDNDATAPVVISFSSWGSESVDQFLGMFCAALQEETGRLNKTKKMTKELVKKISEYGELLSDVYAPAGVASKAVGKALGKGKGPIALKEDVGNLLRKLKRKIVVAIDDIDRLPDEQVRHVFQFVSVVADFPNVVYILPFDYDVVATALSGIQGVDGAAYMQKIIQVPLSLPDPAPGTLEGTLVQELDDLIDFDRDDFSQQRLESVVRSIVLSKVKTLRDIRRLQNVLRFQMGILGSELNSIDILGLSALVAFDPLLYEWVKKNKVLLVGRGYGISPDNHIETLERELKRFGYAAGDIPNAFASLKALFPIIDSSVIPSRRDRWRERRVCHEDIFDCYFAGQIVSPLPERSVGDALYEGDIEYLQKAADLALARGKFVAFIEEILSRTGKIKDEVEPDVAKLLLLRMGRFENSENGRLFFTSPDDKIHFVVDELLKKAGSEVALTAMVCSVKEMDVPALAAFSTILNTEELAHGRLAADSSDESKQLLIPDDLMQVEETFLSRVRELSATSDFRNCENMLMLVYLWRCFDEDGCKTYWNDLIENDPMVLCSFINDVATRWNSSTGEYGWNFSETILEPIVALEKARGIINSLRDEGRLSELEEERLLKVIVYYENGYTGFNSDDRWSASKAKAAMPFWMGSRVKVE